MYHLSPIIIVIRVCHNRKRNMFLYGKSLSWPEIASRQAAILAGDKLFSTAAGRASVQEVFLGEARRAFPRAPRSAAGRKLFVFAGSVPSLSLLHLGPKNTFPNPPSTHFVPIEGRMAKFSPARKARKTSFKNQLFPGYAENNLLMFVYGRR